MIQVKIVNEKQANKLLEAIDALNLNTEAQALFAAPDKDGGDNIMVIVHCEKNTVESLRALIDWQD